MPSATRTDLRALRSMIEEADLLITTLDLPEGRSIRAHELLSAAKRITDQLLVTAKAKAAAALGKRGGQKTAERGSEYFRQIAALRKHRAGGRPPKKQEPGKQP
jgi:hypothetical protein